MAADAQPLGAWATMGQESNVNSIDRTSWLKEMRHETEEKYDTLWAPLYGETVGIYGNTTHQQFVREFVRLLPHHGRVLDAACGAGRYLPLLLEAGHSVLGVDQSQGMLARAKVKFPTVQFEKVGLQELSYHDAFDGVICMDAMENVFPEDWPLVLSNFHQALKSEGYLYFTVEMADENAIEQAFTKAQQSGLPVVYGECPSGDAYHYYPSIPQIMLWVQASGFNVLKEGVGDEYHHLLVHKVP